MRYEFLVYRREADTFTGASGSLCTPNYCLLNKTIQYYWRELSEALHDCVWLWFVVPVYAMSRNRQEDKAKAVEKVRELEMITCMTNYLKIRLLWRQKRVRIRYSMQERSEDCALSVFCSWFVRLLWNHVTVSLTKQSRNGKKRGSKSASWGSLWEDWTLKWLIVQWEQLNIFTDLGTSGLSVPLIVQLGQSSSFKCVCHGSFCGTSPFKFPWSFRRGLEWVYELVHDLWCQYSSSVSFVACDGTRNNVCKTRLDYGSICDVSKNCRSWRRWESGDTWVSNGESLAHIKFGALLLLKAASTKHCSCVLREILIPESVNEICETDSQSRTFRSQ